MRVTGTGHASMRIDTAAGSILCDPWVNPAYFASWFPFPDNSQLDWEALGDFDYLYVSHLHRDHFDAEHLRASCPRRPPSCCPSTRPASWRTSCGRSASPASSDRNDEVIELDGGLKVMIQALTCPTDGPIGDSSLWVEYDGVRLLNQNDARPTDLAVFAELGHVHAHLLQFSGAIWYPMVYELPQAAKTAFGKQKRDRQFDRTFRYIDDLKADHVFPIAGPPCFLDDELWQFNDIFGDEGNIFPDQQVFMAEYAKVGGTTAIVLLPGTVAEVTADDCDDHAPGADVDEFFANKEAHLQEYAGAPAAGDRGGQGVLAAPRDRRAGRDEAPDRAAAGGVDLPGQGRRRPGPLRPGRHDGEQVVESIVVDFPGKEVRPYADEKVRYRFRTERALVEHLLHIGEVDWVNSLFLSCRFSAARIGQYNEFVYAFFKCLSEERLQYAEGWYDEHERATDAEDITLGDWVVQRRCPHLKADLTRFGIVDGDTLTCQLHGWKFDLACGPVPDQRRPRDPRPPRRRPDAATGLGERRSTDPVAVPARTRPSSRPSSGRHRAERPLWRLEQGPPGGGCLGSAGEVGEDPAGGVVAGGADDGAGRVAAGAAGVEAVDAGGVRHPVGEGDRVVDVVDVPAGDAEVRLDAGRRQRHTSATRSLVPGAYRSQIASSRST